jgi:hypothetical protein
MTGTERKRAWRLRNPERSREAEWRRAQERRNNLDGGPVLGVGWVGTSSYARYEGSLKRRLQRHWYRQLGPGTTGMTHGEKCALAHANGVARLEAQKALDLAEFPDLAELFPHLYGSQAA